MPLLGFASTFLNQALKGLKRFPLVSACIVGLYILTFFERNVLSGSFLLYFNIAANIALITTFFFESQGRNSNLKYFLPIILSLIIFACFRFYPGKYLTDLFAFLIGINLLFFISPFLYEKNNISLSYFWQRIIESFSWSITYFIIFSLGITLVSALINSLFDNIIPKSFYRYLWSFSSMIVLPITFLGLLPTKTEIYADRSCNAPRNLKILISWMLVPLCLLFLTVLYAYFTKSLVTAEFPKTTLVMLIILISLYSMFVYLISYPLIHENNKPALFIHRYLSLLLLIPCAILSYRFGVRILSYCLTEPRFYVLLIIVWLAGNILYQIVMQSRKQESDLRIPFISSALLLLLVSLSPISPVNFNLNPPRSIYEYLKDNKSSRYNSMYLLSNRPEKAPAKEISYSVFSFSPTESLNIKDYDYFIPISFNAVKNSDLKDLKNGLKLRSTIEGKYIVFEFSNENSNLRNQVIQIPYEPILMTIYNSEKLKDKPKRNNNVNDQMGKPFTMEYTQNNISVQLVLKNINFKILTENPNSMILQSGSGELIVKLNNW